MRRKPPECPGVSLEAVSGAEQVRTRASAGAGAGAGAEVLGREVAMEERR